MNILLGVTGSVATTLLPKIVESLETIGNVKIVATGRSAHFMRGHDAVAYSRMYTDDSEWKWENKGLTRPLHPMRDWYEADDPVLHIELRKWADVLVIAPLSAHTMAKMTYGLCDNLLTSIFLAWDWTKPVVIAPAMNTLMWEALVTQQNLMTLKQRFMYGMTIVDPIAKELACKDHGIGALARIEDICTAVRDATRWRFPLHECSGIPVGHHPGAFGFVRKHSQHGGVDLYTTPFASVHAVEGGVVVSVENFTGPLDGSPWWNDTSAVLVKGASGVVCYGEISPNELLKVGSRVKKGDYIGKVIPVLPEGKERPDIPGHSRHMLHMELYSHDREKASEPKPKNAPFPEFHRDPTPYLLDSIGAKDRLPEWEPIS